MRIGQPKKTEKKRRTCCVDSERHWKWAVGREVSAEAAAAADEDT